MSIKQVMSKFVRALLLAAGLAAIPAGADATPYLGGTSWSSDPAKHCLIMGFDLHSNGTAFVLDTDMDELVGKWKLTGTTLEGKFFMDENHPPLVFKGEVNGDVIQATYTWNEGADGGPETEQCEFRRERK